MVNGRAMIEERSGDSKAMLLTTASQIPENSEMLFLPPQAKRT